MRKFNSIMQLLVALFFAISLVFFLSFNSLKGLIGLEELTSGTVVSLLLVGLILFLVAWVTNSMVYKDLELQISKRELEKNELKAKLYDRDQDTKIQTLEKKIEHGDEDRESSVIRKRQNFKD
jgi:nitrogen fixation-related uncharacterized protein